MAVVNLKKYYYEKMFREQFKKDNKTIYKRKTRRIFKKISNDFGNGNYYKKLSPFNLFNYV